MASDTHAAEHGHSLLHHHFDDLAQQRESNSMGMWLFLATEAMMFGGLFFTYTLYRWQYLPAYEAGAHLLNHWLGFINTLVLLVSSLTMALAVHAAVVGKRGRLVGWLIATWLLGAVFLGIKAVEWTTDFHEGLIPAINWSYYQHHPGQVAELLSHGVTPNHVQLYFCVYFCMTGLHAIHMVAGLILVGWFIFLAAKGHFDRGNDQPVEIMGLYWHLVDIIWVFLFPLLYLVKGFRWGGGH